MTDKVGKYNYSRQLTTEISDIYGRRITGVQTITRSGVKALNLSAASYLDEQQQAPLPYQDIFKSLEKLLSRGSNTLTPNQFSDISQFLLLNQQRRAGTWKGRSIFAAIAANRSVDQHTIRESIFRGLAHLLDKPYEIVKLRVKAMNSKEPHHRIAVSGWK